MRSKILWKANRSKKNNSNLFRYEKFLSSKYNFKVTQKYKKLIDWSIKNYKDIPIEERSPEELSHIYGLDDNGNIKKVQIYPKKSKAKNLAFDVTPAKYVKGLITEKGICEASENGLKKLFK